MSWDPVASKRRLLDAIEALDRPLVAELCGELIAFVYAEPEPYPLVPARRILEALRGGRHFALLQRVADALIQSGRDEPVIRRHYAQALLDQGTLSAAVAVLERLAAEADGPGTDYAEARGLLGRAYKQMAIAASAAPPHTRARFLARAITEYRDVYVEMGERWHGVNAVALLELAARDGIALPADPEPATSAATLAREILIAIEDLGEKADVWDHGTAVEVCVALGDTEQALEWLDAYVRAGAKAFHLGSTLRQLTEVWGLDAAVDPGAHLLPVLKAELLRREGDADVLVGRAELSARMAARIQDDPQFEKVLGTERFENLRWFRTALERCRAVARIEDPLRSGVATGFLVDGKRLASWLPDVVLVTNAHVIDPSTTTLTFDEAVVTFRALEDASAPYRVVRLWWSSPRDELDVTILELDGQPPEATRCPIAARRPVMDTDPPPKAYIIGHPGGIEDVMLSVSDNHVLDHDDNKLQYRTPTLGGSSGSPVFNHVWQLMAVHHAGNLAMPRLNGPGVHPANEGIWFDRVVRALEAAEPPAA